MKAYFAFFAGMFLDAICRQLLNVQPQKESLFISVPSFLLTIVGILVYRGKNQ